MKSMKKFFKHPNFWPLLVVVVFAILAGRTLIFEKGYFNMHDDLQMMRQLEMEKCFKDWQIPCRWVPDMGYGYGFPLFNFYPPLPYLVGQIFRVLQFSFVDTAKLTFALSFVLSGIAMYFLAKEFFGRWGGVVSSIFYIWAPYHSVDVYVRGAMDEAWAFIWFPLILFTSYKLIKSEKKVLPWILGLGLSWAGLLLSHNLMVMIFTPVFAVWCLIFWIPKHDIKKIFHALISGISAFLLAAFFTLPVLAEQKYIHVDTLTQGYYEYIAHFATIRQLLFSRFWGYGASIWGPNDGMSFQIGQIHWVLSIVILILALSLVFRKKKISDSLKAAIFMVLAGWFAAFMAHQNSTFIWQRIAPLAFVQFPWRFLTLATLGFSFASGSIAVLLQKKVFAVIGLVLVLLLTTFDWNYFLPQGGQMGALTDAQKFSGAAWDLQRTAGIFDYLPKTAKENPKAPPAILAEVTKGKGTVDNISQGTDWGKFSLNLNSDSQVRINIFDFPTWKITVDSKEVDPNIPESESWGRMYLNIPKGEHQVYYKLTDTPVRTASNLISLFAWILLAAIILFRKIRPNSKLASF